MDLNLKLIFIPVSLLLFIGCDSISESEIYTPSSESCSDGESMGCDDICSTSPIQNDICGVCGGDGQLVKDCGIFIMKFQFLSQHFNLM